jgi:hypothetical protein
MANLKLIYPSGAGTQVTYNAVKNYDYGISLGYLETDDHARGFDGTLNSYAGPRKKTFELTFSYALKTQFDYFQNLWTFQCPIDIYLDGVNLDATVKMMAPPNGKSEAAFENPGEPTYSFTVNFEEV